MDATKLQDLLARKEDYDIEFKEAKRSFSVQNLHDYCAAISNESGGYLLLGVNDAGKVVGTNLFDGTWNKLAYRLSENLDVRVKVFEVQHEDGRVLVMHVAQHYFGRPVEARGGTGGYRYPIRNGESLVEMDANTFRLITQEVQVDFSAQTAVGVAVSDLDQDALYHYRSRWAEHTKNSTHLKKKYAQMLQDIGMIKDKKLTNAALLLFGAEDILRDHIPDAEIIFEWRNNATDIRYGARKSWRSGFLVVIDDVWSTISARNTSFHYQEGFTKREIDAYDEESIREAVTNAFVHRDYMVVGSSIIIKASPDKFYIENPGNFMAGVTVDNIFDKSVYRNRLLAESLEKINIMERSSQGVDTIFTRAIEDGKGRPRYDVTTDPSIQLTIPAKLVDKEFVAFLEEVINKKGVTLSSGQILELEMIRTGEQRTNLKHKERFLELGLIEKYGRGRGQKYILSHKYYSASGKAGEHTRITGLPREMKRAVIIEHLKKHQRVTNSELQHALPDMTANEISTLLKGMKRDGLIVYEGDSPRWGYWRLEGGVSVVDGVSLE